MANIPFPSTLAQIAIDTLRSRHEAAKAKAGKSTRAWMRPEPFTSHDAPLYRTEAGSIHTVYDPWAPAMPEGATPGLGTVNYTVKYHHNGDHSYVPNIASFKSAADLEAEGLAIDYTAAALVKAPGAEAELMIAANEETLAVQLEGIDPAAIIRRQQITRVGLEPGEFMTHFAGASAVGGTEIFGATNEADLGEALRKRYNFITDADDLNDVLDHIAEHGNEHGWIVANLTRQEPEASLSEVGEEFGL